MKIYAEEEKRGLRNKILASTIVTVQCPVRPSKDPSKIAAIQSAHSKYLQTEAGRAFASYNDLYFVDTILATAGAPYSNTNGGFNKNDDFFSVEETWRARHTPVDKPVNISHDSNLTCGHMTRSWVLSAGKRKVIPDNRSESDLPNTIHLASAAVIYRELGSWYQDQINKTILSIEAGEMAVSMEAHFNEFDYALLDESTGTVKIVTRNEETAWMTWLLRWFGGEGIYIVKDDNGKVKEYYRVGRALRNITFTGKGFVQNPANPDSIILQRSFEKSDAADEKAVDSNKLAAGRITVGNTNSNKGEKKMSDIDPKEYADVLATAKNAEKVERQNEKLLAKVETLEYQIKANEKIVTAFEMGKKEFETLLEAAKKEKEKDEKEKAELAEQLKAAKKKEDEDEKDKKDKAEKIEKLEKELAELKDAQQSADRQSMLLKEGVEAKDAEAFVKIYASFTSEQFKAVADTLIENYRNKKAIAQLQKDGKVTAEEFENMKPTLVDTKGEDDETKEGGSKNKSKSGFGLFASFASALPTKK